MTYVDPFTAQLNDDLTPITTQEDTITTPELPTYDPEIHTLIDGTVIEIDATGGQRLSNGKTLVDTVKHTQSIEQIRSLTEYGKATANAYESLNNRTNRATAGLRSFLEALWESGLDQTQLAEVFAEHDLPTPKKVYNFTATITLSVYGIKGTGKDEDEAWDDAINNSMISDAFSDGNYDTYSLEEPSSYDEVEADEDDAEDPDFNAVNIFDLT